MGGVNPHRRGPKHGEPTYFYLLEEQDFLTVDSLVVSEASLEGYLESG